jgi:hypothetical protein
MLVKRRMAERQLLSGNTYDVVLVAVIVAVYLMLLYLS